MTKHSQAGFSAVELLITLFVAATFVAAGFQLYTVVIQNGGDARARAKASNIAYDNLRRYTGQAQNPCAVVTPNPTPTIPSGSLSNAAITVTFSCPYGATGTTKVNVRITYGNPQQEVVHAVYVTP